MAATTCPTASGAFTLVHLVTLLHLLASIAYANPPLIHYSHNMRILKIPVHTEPGSIVYRIKASDADNENVVFGVLEDYGQALLRFDKANHHEANVVLLLPLQENDEFNLTVYATDNNESTYIESRLIATTVPAVQITLTPLVLQQNPVYVNENETLNRSIATVRAYDREDSKLPVTFELLENTNLFDFNYVFGPRGMSTAELVLINKLDYEKQNLYILTLLAINAQTNEEVDTRNVHTVTLSIVVQDVQDSPPVFTNLPQLVSIDVEHHQMSDIIYNVTAHDGDTVNQRNVTFSILEPNKEIFRITSNGSVYLLKSPEEIGDIFSEHKPAQVDIQANEIVLSDELLENKDTSSVSQLLVRFVSANRPPQYKADHLVGHIDEHSAPHSAVVWQVEGDLAQVLDLDQGLNGTIALELIDAEGTFTIEPSVAYRQAKFTLLVNDSASLDFETRRNLSVMIIAKDKSEEAALSSNITCTIFIDDINDNYPQFSERLYESAIYENAPEGSSVAQIVATDKDSGDFGQVRFTGLKGIFAKSLAIDSISGIVKLTNNSELDRELVAEYVVTVEARDNLGTGNLNTTELYIRVLDVNDNPPIFLQPSYLALLNSEMTSFVQPLQMSAIDIDEMNNSNSVVNYEILQGNYEGLFTIDQHSGKVAVRESAGEKRLSPGDGSNITLTVRAYDLGVPQLSSTTLIFIYTMNRPNTIKAHFISKRRISPLSGHESLEKALSDITGGNVTISEVKPEKESQPNSIAASVQYRNESIMDLDVMAKALDRLVVRDGSHFEPDKHVERETEIIPTKGNTDQNASNRQVHNHNDDGKQEQSGSSNQVTTSTTNNSNREVISSRLFHTSQWGNLDLLLWIMIILILFLLIILIYLLCLLCKDKGKSKTIITQTEVPTSNPVLSNGRSVVRAKRRKSRPVRNANKVVDVSKKVKDSIVTVALEDEQCSRDQSFDVEEEKKYATKTTDNMVTYYEYKRLRYPKQNEVKTTNVLTLERMDPTVDNSPNIDHDQQIEGNAGQVSFLNVPTNIATNEGEEGTRIATTKPVSFSVMQTQQNSSVRIDGGAYPAHNLFEGAAIDMAGENNMRSGSYRNLQKKSIFAITYDRINSRENISAGSENVN